jgi:hypothetical protein
MEMNVDQPRGDDMVFDVDHGCAVRGKINADGVEFPVADANIECTISPGSRVDHATTFKDEIGE